MPALMKLPARLLLAARYWHRLNYSWHLAWAKAAR